MVKKLTDYHVLVIIASKRHYPLTMSNNNITACQADEWQPIGDFTQVSRNFIVTDMRLKLRPELSPAEFIYPLRIGTWHVYSCDYGQGIMALHESVTTSQATDAEWRLHANITTDTASHYFTDAAYYAKLSDVDTELTAENQKSRFHVWGDINIDQLCGRDYGLYIVPYPYDGQTSDVSHAFLMSQYMDGGYPVFVMRNGKNYVRGIRMLRENIHRFTVEMHLRYPNTNYSDIRRKGHLDITTSNLTIANYPWGEKLVELLTCAQGIWRVWTPGGLPEWEYVIMAHQDYDYPDAHDRESWQLVVSDDTSHDSYIIMPTDETPLTDNGRPSIRHSLALAANYRESMALIYLYRYLICQIGYTDGAEVSIYQCDYETVAIKLKFWSRHHGDW